MFVKLVDFRSAQNIRSDSIVSVKSPLLYSNDKAMLNEFFNDLLLFRRVVKTQSGKISKFKMHAIGLIRYFDKKYHLDDE
jgi:hypothetical protein